jgi:hypothetical protein
MVVSEKVAAGHFEFLNHLATNSGRFMLAEGVTIFYKIVYREMRN